MPVGAPRDLDVRITSPNSAYATWTGVPDKRETARGKLLGYKVSTFIHLFFFILNCFYVLFVFFNSFCFVCRGKLKQTNEKMKLFFGKCSTFVMCCYLSGDM